MLRSEIARGKFRRYHKRADDGGMEPISRKAGDNEGKRIGRVTAKSHKIEKKLDKSSLGSFICVGNPYR